MPIATPKDCKKCRRECEKLFLKGAKCYSPKCPVLKRAYPPGMHGLSRRPKLSEYGLQLREKQKIKRIYGLLERQFRNYFEKATKKKGVAGENLLLLLESRLDTIVFKGGLATSMSEARQLVRHRQFLVNGKKVDIPSYQVKIGDKIKVKSENNFFKELKEKFSKDRVASWITTDIKVLGMEVLRIPERSELDPSLKEHLVVELYSK